jgi:hypothetical protein
MRSASDSHGNIIGFKIVAVFAASATFGWGAASSTCAIASVGTTVAPPGTTMGDGKSAFAMVRARRSDAFFGDEWWWWRWWWWRWRRRWWWWRWR